MADLLDQLTERFDMVLLDSPPLLPVTDGAILGRLAGTTLVVVGADRLHRSQLRGALESLTTAGVHVSGVVLNKVAPHDFGPYEYGYTAMQSLRPGDDGPEAAAPGRDRAAARRRQGGRARPGLSPGPLAGARRTTKRVGDGPRTASHALLCVLGLVRGPRAWCRRDARRRASAGGRERGTRTTEAPVPRGIS